MDAGEIPNFLDHASLVQRESRPTIQLDDTGTAHALGKVLVRGADDHAFDTFVSSGRSGPGSERVVRHEFHHRPDDNASGCKDVFEQVKLCQQVGFDAFAGLVAWP